MRNVACRAVPGTSRRWDEPEMRPAYGGAVSGRAAPMSGQPALPAELHIALLTPSAP